MSEKYTVTDTMRYLLTRYGYNGKKLSDAIESSANLFEQFFPDEQSKVVNNMHKLRIEIYTWDHSEEKTRLTKEEKTEKNQNFKRRIGNLWKKSPSEGGLGRQLVKNP